MLLELGLPSFNTVIHNAKVKFTARTVTVINSVISTFRKRLTFLLMLVHIVYKLSCVIPMYGYVCMWGLSAGGSVCMCVVGSISFVILILWTLV